MKLKLRIKLAKMALSLMNRFEESGDYAQDNLVSNVITALEDLVEVIDNKIRIEND